MRFVVASGGYNSFLNETAASEHLDEYSVCGFRILFFRVFFADCSRSGFGTEFQLHKGSSYNGCSMRLGKRYCVPGNVALRIFLKRQPLIFPYCPGFRCYFTALSTQGEETNEVKDQLKNH